MGGGVCAYWAMTVTEASNQSPVGVRLVSQVGTHVGLCKPGQNPKAGKVMERPSQTCMFECLIIRKQLLGRD